MAQQLTITLTDENLANLQTVLDERNRHLAAVEREPMNLQSLIDERLVSIFASLSEEAQLLELAQIAEKFKRADAGVREQVKNLLGS